MLTFQSDLKKIWQMEYAQRHELYLYSSSCLDQGTANRPFGLPVKLSPANTHLFTTRGGDFTLSLLRVLG